jgi:transcriptional regulator with XRE-family HTH domain
MEQLKRLRTEKGLSQARLAARAEVDPSTVNQIERGAREASPATLRKLAHALDVSLFELLGDDSPKVEPSLPFEEQGDEQRRREKYLPWLEFANRYSERWYERADRGDLDESAIREWKATLQDLGKSVLRLREEEELGWSQEKILEMEDELIMRKVGASFMGPLTTILDAHQALLNEDELARFRRERESVERDLDLAVNG